ncbi:unnamed protein product, partial [Owenia fusiformis]
MMVTKILIPLLLITTLHISGRPNRHRKNLRHQHGKKTRHQHLKNPRTKQEHVLKPLKPRIRLRITRDFLPIDDKTNTNKEQRDSGLISPWRPLVGPKKLVQKCDNAEKIFSSDEKGISLREAQRKASASGTEDWVKSRKHNVLDRMDPLYSMSPSVGGNRGPAGQVKNSDYDDNIYSFFTCNVCETKKFFITEEFLTDTKTNRQLHLVQLGHLNPPKYQNIQIGL